MTTDRRSELRMEHRLEHSDLADAIMVVAWSAVFATMAMAIIITCAI